MSKRILLSLLLISLVGAGRAFGQQTGQAELGPAELKELIRRAGIAMNDYRAKFKDLTAQEEQKIEEYDEQGKLTKQRLVASDLVIYQSQLDPTMMVEYRDVKSVDGKAVKKREERLMELLKKTSKADSLKKELDRISRESVRYDLGNSFYGETLNQGLPLAEKWREVFEFKFAGREQVNGGDAIVVEYQQIAQSPHLKFDIKNFPAPLRAAEPFYRGRLWFDPETAQLRKEMREWTLRLPSLTDPLVMFRFDYDYAASRFGFLTPQRIVITGFTRGRTVDKKPVLQLGARTTYTYGAFSRFDVETPDAALDPPAKP